MAESTLSPTFSAIRDRLCRELTGIVTYASLSTSEQAFVDDLMEDGYQQFLMPPVIPGERSAYAWKWLKPINSLVVWPTLDATVSGQPVFSSPTSTVTLTAAGWHPSMVGHSVVFDTSGNSYVIAGYTSSTVVTVTGDASSETSGDGITVTADGDYSLPDAFGGIDGGLTFSSSGFFRRPIDVVNELQIRRERQHSSTSGYPAAAAIAPRAFDGTVGQRWQLMLWPTPNAEYTIEYRGTVLPDLYAAVTEYPAGGLPYSAALRESILAAAETATEGAQGTRFESFMRFLQAAIEFDRRANTAESVGINRDRSDTNRDAFMDPRSFQSHASWNVAYNGQVYRG